MSPSIASAKPKFSLAFSPLAKDLILKMLVKNSEQRLSASEVKEHPWLKQYSLIKPSATPKPVDILKVDPETPQISTGYQVISKAEVPVSSIVTASIVSSSLRASSVSRASELRGSKTGEEDMQYSDSSEGTQSDIFEELTIKENLERLKGLISTQREEQYTHKANISVKELEINNRLARVRDLQTAIEEKAAYKNYLMRNIEKHSNLLTEKTAESEKLLLIASPEQLNDLVAANRANLSEKTAKLALEAASLKQSKAYCDSLSSEVSQKERLMNDLSSKLQKIHSDFKSNRLSLTSNLSEVKLNCALMQSRLKAGPRKSLLQPEDQQRAEDLVEFIGKKMREMDGEGSAHVRKLVETMENAVFAKEEEINAMMAGYERKKLDLRQGFQVKMREIKQNQREEQAKLETLQRTKAEKKRAELRDALQTIRDQNYHSFYSLEDYSRIKEMYLVSPTQELQARHSSLQQSLERLLTQRSQLTARLAELEQQEVVLRGRRRK